MNNNGADLSGQLINPETIPYISNLMSGTTGSISFDGIGWRFEGNIDLTGATLSGLRITGLVSSSDFEAGILLQNATVEGCNFDDATLTFGVALGVTIADCSFLNATFVPIPQSGGFMLGGTVSGTAFDGATLNNVFSGGVTVNAGCSFRNVQAGVFNVAFAAPCCCDGIAIDMQGYSGYPLGGSPFTVSFIGATFANATFGTVTACVFDGAKFTHCQFTGVVTYGSFANVTFDNTTQFVGATLSQVNLESCDLADAGWDQSYLAYVAGYTWQMTGGRFTNIMLTTGGAHGLPVAWQNLNLSGATIVWLGGMPTTFQGYSFVGCTLPVSMDLSNADLDGVDFTGATLDGMRFGGASMAGTILVDASLRSATLEYADLEGANFTGAHLAPLPGMGATSFQYAWMPNATLDNADLTGVSFAYAQLYGPEASMVGATLVETDFSGANLSGMDLSNTTFSGVLFDGANLINAAFTNTTFVPSDKGQAVSFANASLQGANFTNARFQGVRFTNAVVALTPGSIPVEWIGPNDTLLSGTVAYPATAIDGSAIGPSCTCPDGTPGPCSGSKFVARAPPQPPACVSDGTNWCPIPKKG